MGSLSRYRFIRRLGSGGAGKVWLVEDLLRPGSELALKRLRARADALLRASFEREFAVVAALSLPGVARVVDFGLAPPDGDDPGGPYFTRAYVPGKPMDQALAGKRPSEVVLALRQVCAVVAPLHRMGVVHGDLKPQNLILEKGGSPQVIDFGLARLPADVGMAGAGTPAFMAPECLRGEPASARSDVYALAATLWSLLTGALPFDSPAAKLSAGVPEIPKGVRGAAREALEVARRGLEPDALSRLPSLAELSAALEPIAPGDIESPAGFVPPAPRGHEDLLAQLEAQTMAWIEGRGGKAATLLTAPFGGGKTTLARALRWRLQLRGVQVLALSVHAGAPVAPLSDLLAQSALVSGDKPRAVEGEARAAAACAAIGVVAAAGPTVVIVDDLDLAEAVVGRTLREALHSGEARVGVVATATDGQAAAVRELGAKQVRALPPLSESDVGELVRQSLGAVDRSVGRALHGRTGGLPGALVDALSQLAGTDGLTTDDVRDLRTGEAGEIAARARLDAAPEGALEVLAALSLAPLALPAAFLASASGADAACLERCALAGLLAQGDRGWVLADAGVREVLRDDRTAEETQALARRLVSHAAFKRLPVSVRAGLATQAGDAEAIERLVPDGAAELEAEGALSVAIELLEALAAVASGEPARTCRADLARLLHSVGRYEEAERVALQIAQDRSAPADAQAAAAVLAGRAGIAAGAFDRALSVLELPAQAPDHLKAQALREQAKARLRQGDYAATEKAARAGLELAPGEDPVRVELLTCLGMVGSYRGDHEAAHRHYSEALAIARGAESRRDEANVLTYMAIDRHRAGAHDAARELYEQSLAIAREMGDVGSMATFALNLGAICYELGDPARAAGHYEAAASLARRAGRGSTDVLARANLAQLHVYLGSYERARIEADEALQDALDAGMKPAAAQATALLGDLCARTGDLTSALSRYDEATELYRQLGQPREVVEATLDSAEALLDGSDEAAEVVTRLADARQLMTEEQLSEFDLRHRLLAARARARAGDVDTAAGDLEAVLDEVTKGRNRDLHWLTLAASARLNALRGADFVARRQEQEAMEVLESIATGLPREYRECFWQDPRRQQVRRQASGISHPSRSSVSGPVVQADGTFHGAGIEARAARLLELIKRLASEHDVDRLLDRITDSAVELVGAERGFLLLVGADGKLAPRSVRDRQDNDPHVAFSRSIAEAVLIDGEPIITVDASDDVRLSEYMSVHKLMLKSVACLPVRGRSGAVGVLYLEHRMRRGRFDEADVDLLFAFADQAAIALENARLIAENTAALAELEQANRDLAAAKAQTERVLVARTAELQEAKREVDQAREELRAGYERHGLVGQSDAIREVVAMAARMGEVTVPVVIEGESGTGKELVARAIHYGGERAEGPFVALNCAAIPEALLESELFGHVRGAFTGAERDRRGVIARASGGTLFLDEVGDMPGKMQVDLLRVLQDSRVRPIGGSEDEVVDVRIICASNRSLPELVAQGKFREDLYYRLNVVAIRVPPLRERLTDIPLLSDHFLAMFAERDGASPKRLSREALDRLSQHPWPGNVRQLEHVLLNAWVMVEGAVIEASDLALDEAGAAAPVTVRKAAAAPVRPSAPPAPASLDDYKATEKQRILAALERHNWNRAKAARELDMPRRTFYRRLTEHDIL